MGFCIEKKTCEAILNSSLGKESPYSYYHGTTPQNMEGIEQNSFLSSYGMLGTAVYFGTFWKAARFACLGQDYKFRDGIVIRTLLFVKSLKTLPEDGYSCSCCTHPGHLISDHLGYWQEKYDALRVLPCTKEIGKCRDGTSKYLLRNEEWAVLPNKTVITHCAKIDPNTFSGPHYDPLHRAVKIL
jgi:hypothetical protein